MRRTLLLVWCALARAQDARDVHNLALLTAQLSRSDLEHLDDEGYNALHRAAMEDAAEVVDVILRKQVDVDLVSSEEQWELKHGMTALAMAANKGHADVVQKLLAAAADVDKRTPIVLAASSAHIDVVRTLLAAGANVNARALDMSGTTALGAAASMGHAAVADVLIEAGADPTIKDDNGVTPMAAANEYARLAKENSKLRATIERTGGGAYREVLLALRKAVARHAKRAGKMANEKKEL